MDRRYLTLSLATLLSIGAAGCADGADDGEGACAPGASCDEAFEGSALRFLRRDGGRGWPRRDAGTQVDAALDAGATDGATEHDAGPLSSECEQPGAVERTRRAGDRVLSAGAERWVLWSTTTRREIASGAMPPAATGLKLPIDLAGTLALVPTNDGGFALRDARDGHVIVTLEGDGGALGSAGLARDGSYAWRATSKSLTAWSAAGEVLARRVGSYDGQIVFAAPGQLRVALRWDPHSYLPTQLTDGTAAVIERVELVNTKDGTARLTPHWIGLFEGWFDDGVHYMVAERAPAIPWLTTDTFRWFSAETEYKGGVTMDSSQGFVVKGGFADHYWAVSGGGQRMGFYPLTIGGSGQLPAPDPSVTIEGPGLTGALRSDRGSVAVFRAEEGAFSIADVRGYTPTVTDVQLPSPVLPASFASDDVGHWAIGTTDAVLYVSDSESVAGPYPLGCRAP